MNIIFITWREVFLSICVRARGWEGKEAGRKLGRGGKGVVGDEELKTERDREKEEVGRGGGKEG